jgi:hypothetical protein
VPLLAERTWFTTSLIIYTRLPARVHCTQQKANILAFTDGRSRSLAPPVRHSFVQHSRSPSQLICHLRTHPQPPNSSRTHSRNHCVKAPDRHLDLARHAALCPRFPTPQPPCPALSFVHFFFSVLSTEHVVAVTGTLHRGRRCSWPESHQVRRAAGSIRPERRIRPPEKWTPWIHPNDRHPTHRRGDRAQTSLTTSSSLGGPRLACKLREPQRRSAPKRK